MKRINWKVVLSNLAEAREEVERIQNRIKQGNLSEEEFQVFIEHAYHHLNFAWNARHCRMQDYRKLSTANFNRWSKFPLRLCEFQLDSRQMQANKSLQRTRPRAARPARCPAVRR
jgi:hypothetical protein